MRYQLIVLIALLSVAAGCGGEASPVSDAPVKAGAGRVPDVTGLGLDAAKRVLARRGLEAVVHDEGFGEVIVESNWTVCEQWPNPGNRATTVDLYVEHFCDEEYDDDD
jgi:hypothetical protein